MALPTLTRLTTSVASVVLLAHCASEAPPPPSCNPGTMGCVSSGGFTGASGAPAAGTISGAGTGTSPVGMAGTVSASGAGAGAGAGTSSSSGAPSFGGATANGGSGGSAIPPAGAPAGGMVARGGSAGSAGVLAGSSSVGGSSPSGGSSGASGNTAAGGNGAAGSSTMGGNPVTGGGMAGMGGSGPVVDQNGVPLARPGDSRNKSREYLNLGDIRLLVNKWGSDELGCGTSLRVFVNNDKTLGWEIDRGACGGNKQKPDYPELEFGIHPFGAGNSLATTPSFSSTKALPIQIKDVTSASVVLDSLNINVPRASTFNLNFEFWLSQRNPVTEADPGVHAELITFFGWQDDWACDKSGNVQAGDRAFNLCHQDDAWAGGKWRYFQFRLNGGPSNGFSGKIDVKAFLDWLVNTRGYSKDLWITRFEIGSEIDDNTKATVTLKNVTFEVNGTSKSVQLAQ